MAKEILSVPEEHLADVIKVIRAGLQHNTEVIDDEVDEQLTTWCCEMELYLSEGKRE